jgi:hypothetical protein
VTFTEKERANEAPELTAVKTTGELLLRPMSMYTVNSLLNKSQDQKAVLTMNAAVNPTNGRNRRSTTDDELVPLALVVCGLWLAELHLVHVQPDAVQDINKKNEGSLIG